MLEHFRPLRTWDSRLHFHRRFQSVVCGICGHTENIPVTKSMPLPPELIVKQMQKKGWLMGQRRHHDRCPKCKATHIRLWKDSHD
jgi:predicted nucleic-acid-binding Zn-ribbon protein